MEDDADIVALINYRMTAPIDSDDEDNEVLNDIVTYGRFERINEVRDHLTRHPEKAIGIFTNAAVNSNNCPGGEYLDLTWNIASFHENQRVSAAGLDEAMSLVHQDGEHPDNDTTPYYYTGFRNWVMNSRRDGIPLNEIFAGILAASGFTQTADAYREFPVTIHHVTGPIM